MGFWTCWEFWICQKTSTKHSFMHKLEGWEMWVTSLVVKLCCQNSWKRSPLFSSGSLRRKAQGHPSVWDIFFNSKRPGRPSSSTKTRSDSHLFKLLTKWDNRFQNFLSSLNQKIEQKGVGSLEKNYFWVF